MTPTFDGPLEVRITDTVMQQLQNLPPQATDELAAAVAQMIADPSRTTANSRALYPVPVDHSPGREDVYVPATRSVSYLRNAVADISPATVAHFDDELRDATAYDPDRGVDGQVRGLRGFVLRWIDYIAIQGNHATARHIEQAADVDEMAERFSAAMAAAHRRYFPDAGDQDGHELSVQVREKPSGGHTAVCPITQLRAEADTPDKAAARLHALLMEWITG
ncbi:hypothetical protein ACFPC0_10895 [Streptomyces andamanensis]|uniref:Uncharacterized protein n=1 Tax=Streptomyces andamanensis TaxID=1565035 RepID=A0ABV8TCL4_9ACTN